MDRRHWKEVLFKNMGTSWGGLGPAMAFGLVKPPMAPLDLEPEKVILHFSICM